MSLYAVVRFAASVMSAASRPFAAMVLSSQPFRNAIDFAAITK